MTPATPPSDTPESRWPELSTVAAIDILEQLPFAVWIVDTGYRLVYANPVFMTQPPPGMPRPIHIGTRMLPDESDVTQHQRWQQSYRRALDGEHVTITSNTTTYYLQLITIDPVRQWILGYASTFPTTERDTLFRAAIETLPDPFSMYEVIRNPRNQIVDAQIMAVNAAMCQITGYRREELLGQRMLDLWPEFANDGTFASLRHLVESGAPVRRTTTLLDRHGVQQHIELHAGKLANGFVSIWRDITAQQQLDQKIRQQAELLDQLVDAVITTDLHYVVTGWNRGAERIYGWSAGEMIGQQIGERLETRFADTNFEEAAAMLRQTGRWEGEVEQRRRDGQYVPIHSIVVMIRDEQGTPTGIVAVNRDISERRHFEQLLMKANQRLEQAIVEARRQTAEIMMVNELHDLLQVCQTATEAAEVISFSLQRIFPRQSGYLMVHQAGTANLNLLAQWGEADLAPVTMTIDECWALRRGLIHRTCTNAGIRCPHIHSNTPACTSCIPLVVQSEIYGLLHIAGEELPRSELIVMTGDTIKLALSNLELRATLREQAIIDPLTGLYNRRYLENSLPRELHRAQREQVSLTIAMIDIDHFKQFNDTYGHDAGDGLLRELAVIFREHLRQSDLACRYGGEEFVLILPGVSRETARTRLQQLGNTVQQRRITFTNQLIGPVTISIGYVTYEGGEYHITTLLQHADAALYAAKRGGRNRVIDFADLPPDQGDERFER